MIYSNTLTRNSNELFNVLAPEDDLYDSENELHESILNEILKNNKLITYWYDKNHLDEDFVQSVSGLKSKFKKILLPNGSSLKMLQREKANFVILYKDEQNIYHIHELKYYKLIDGNHGVNNYRTNILGYEYVKLRYGIYSNFDEAIRTLRSNGYF